jgi:hypothetical protein
MLLWFNLILYIYINIIHLLFVISISSLNFILFLSTLFISIDYFLFSLKTEKLSFDKF